MAAPFVSLLNGVINPKIEASSFSVVTNVQNNNGVAHGMDLLRRHCCLGARLDSNERFDPPRCDEATRVELSRELMDWIMSEDDCASMLVLYGSAGSGKSALEQLVAERCKKEGQLAASFFFSRTSPNALRSDGNTLIPTLVYQLLQVFPWLKESVVKAIEDDPGILELSRSALMEELFVKHFLSPLNQYPGYGIHPRLIAIDGLDECSGQDIQRDLLSILVSSISQLRYPFRFFLTFRPEPHLMQVVDHHPGFQSPRLRRLDLSEDPNVHDDIRTFLEHEFIGIRKTHPLSRYIPHSWPSSDFISVLVKNASGQFIYADTVIRFVRSPKHRPDDRLNIILGLEIARGNENPFTQLDAVYHYIFSCVKDLDTVWRILGVIELLGQWKISGINHADADISPSTFTSPTSLQNVFMVRPGEIEVALSELTSVVTCPSPDLPIKVIHASLFDFLLNPTRSGPYALDVSLAHETIAQWRWIQISTQGNEKNQKLKFIKQFLFHGRYARLSDKQRQLVGNAALVLVDAIGHDDWLEYEHVQQYDVYFRDLSLVFQRTEFHHREESLEFISAIGAKLKSMRCNHTDTISRIFWTKFEALQCSKDDCVVSSQGGEKGLRSLNNRTAQAMRSLGARFKLQARNHSQTAVEQGKELAGDTTSIPGRTQWAIRVARLLVWTQAAQNNSRDFDPQCLAVLKQCLLFAFESLDAHWVIHTSDAAVVLFIATLLPHCAPGLKDPVLEIDRDLFLKVQATRSSSSARSLFLQENPPALQQFPKIMENYHQEARAYLERMKSRIGAGSL
ncbi:unnamed protein product [Cyclocybe aegerita]|uniref:Nephrocystin 3-like N-terminal domain-containing protein n=1 Tax=Cyclocybe aegerita TaxID=1973307 RepID=A0A8S0X9X5_CYCAE|nr:unnamed protein product [Cyclocybe aegerita]